MNKADGWNAKTPDCEWIRRAETYKARIEKIAGSGHNPFRWSVYPLPRKDHTENGRYLAIARSSAASLADAKVKADRVIQKWLNGER